MTQKRDRTPRSSDARSQVIAQSRRIWAALRQISAAEILLAVDGLAVIFAGITALTAAFESVLGEDLLLLVGGGALVLFGVMIVLRSNLQVVRTGLVGLTAGYFASALSEFEVATDACDIGGVLERCATDVTKGLPYAVYQGPLVLAVLTFALIVVEPRVRSRDNPPPKQG